MDIVWREAIERYSVEPAPPELHLTHSLLNSFGPSAFSEMEMLDDPASAQAWMDSVLREWRARHPGTTVPPITAKTGTIRSVKQLRADVRGLLGDAPPSAEALSAPLQVSWNAGRFELLPQGAGANWLRSAVSSELLLAQEHDLLRRLKVCRNPACLVVFYDRSKSGTRVWHDMARCGTPQHVREWRRRQRTPDSR
ncbi:CGNR zinc finger domain-containing protein [Streptomyces sp. NPDC002018]|uniref:CGNR zinc finger domain-containing protein n=1 Tax=Streptomyces sp. NPDC002018 TaxID=3364629 RepID=UPI0036CFA12C